MARARREALTTAFHITVREEIIALALELIEAATIFVANAKTHSSTIMSDYTYLQAAQPTTFDHLDLQLDADNRHSLPTSMQITSNDGTKRVVAVPTITSGVGGT